MRQASEKVLVKASVGAWEGAASGQRLGELLVARNDVQPADIEKTLQIQKSVGGKLGALLVRTGAISEDLLLPEARRAAARRLSPKRRRSAGQPGRVPVRLGVADQAGVVPRQRGADVESGRGALLHRPRHPGPCTARNPQLLLSGPARGRSALAANHQIDRLLDFVRKERAIENLYSGDSARHLREMAEEAPIIELVNNLLSQAVDLGASDIHVEPSEEQFAVRMRVDGVLHTRLTQPGRALPRGGVPGSSSSRASTSRSAGCPRTGRIHGPNLGPGDGYPGIHGALRVRRIHRAADAGEGSATSSP